MIDENGPDFVEAAMYRTTAGAFAGQYVIGCVHDRCGYLGESGTVLQLRLLAQINDSIRRGALHQTWCISQGLQRQR
jgi:hypothetical protein